MPAQLVDSHCHIPMIEPKEDVEVILSSARDNGVEHMLCVSIDLESYPEVLRLAQQYNCISASVGVHPNAEVSQEPDADQLVALASDPDVIAVGETGLDYFRSEGELDWQRDRMRTHIQAAKAVQKPLIVHSREARQDVIDILAEQGADSVGGVMHCFVDDWQTAQQAMALNFYISFSGIVTFKNAKELKEVAKRVPLDRMLIETDAPYLAPVPYRGKQNQPAYVRHVAEHIAELRGESFERIAAVTSENFSKLFNINIPAVP